MPEKDNLTFNLKKKNGGINELKVAKSTPLMGQICVIQPLGK